MKNKSHLLQSVKCILSIILLLSPCYGWTAAIDPTRPPPSIIESGNTSQTLNANQRLTAIFVFPNMKIAIIDGQSFKQGQHIGEYVVSKIKKNEVELTDKNNKRIMLKLAPSVKSMTMIKKGSSS